MHRELAAPQLGVVDDVVVDEGRRVNELDDGRVKDGAVAFVPAQTRGHEQDGRANALAAARLNILADFWDEIDLRLHVPGELAIDLLEVGANGLENLCERDRGFFHRGLTKRVHLTI